jgi:hypothetical protein
MPGEQTISKQSSGGFPDYLDFDTLRSQSIQYLGRLAGKIWTDHNVHDPGITTLEVLCYAILDLGYRTNLPAKDIFTPDPNSKEAENNFFTPAQVLTCNPLTITDFRKLLIDIPGVVNAWLEIATDVDPAKMCPERHEGKNKCNDKRRRADEEYKDKVHKPVHYLNGLYHVYVQLEKDSDEAKVVDKITKTLIRHRNICEDFIDITVLCKEKIGLCAEIEIASGTEMEKIYLEAIRELREYFSPSPKFYTLENLLVEKQKTIDEIFAGRPHGLSESHGFVDTEEFEKLQLRKKLYLSDIYSVLQKIPGVARVSKLKFNKCNQQGFTGGWEYQLQKNNVPELDLQCTSISFTTKGLPLPFDTRQYTDLLDLNFVDNGKVLYRSPSPYLDASIPTGVFRTDLQQYIPVQNEFPKVYGITEGSLPASATLQRRAQSLQFRGYLFFFDQLLANYLSQLQNVRALFSFAPATGDQKRTYFSNQVTMPGLQDLLRFNAEDGPGFMGTQGSPVAFPVNKKDLLEQVETGCLNLHSLQPFTFSSMADCKIAVSQLLNDIALDEFQFQFASNSDECVYYYLLTSAEEMALVGKKYFSSQADAKRVTEALRYAGLFEENYRSFITPGKKFSFNLEMNLFDYSRYLQRILESEDVYFQRRKSFLDHLLLRFAEQFSDYAILSYRTSLGGDTREQEIAHKEKYLSNYDVLSSNRGKAYDYFKDGWNNGNASGFEKRVNALLGIEGKGRQALCNFEVFVKYTATIKLGGDVWFTSDAQFASRQNAAKFAQEQFNKLSAEFDPHTQVSARTHHYWPQIKKLEDDSLVYTFHTHERSRDEAGKTARKNLNKLNKETVWVPAGEGRPVKLLAAHEEGKKIFLLDDSLFREPDADNKKINASKEFTYDLLAVDNAFGFTSSKTYPDKKTATKQAHQLKALLADERNYSVQKSSDPGKYHVQVNEQGKPVAHTGSYSQKEAHEWLKKIQALVRQHTYYIEADKRTASWGFTYTPGQLSFKSIEEYKSPEDAETAAGIIRQYPEQLTIVQEGKTITLKGDNAAARLEGEHPDVQAAAQTARKHLAIQQEVKALKQANEPETFLQFVPDPARESPAYRYRLVDKNNLYAAYREEIKRTDLHVIDQVYDLAEGGYNYLELPLTGDVTIERVDERKRTWYHYQFRSLNAIRKPGAPGQQRQLVLFESIKGYQSAREALEAYQNDFYLVLEKAMQLENYGDEQLITVRELFERNEFTGRFGKAIVRVPKETMDFLGGYEAQSISQLINVVKTYPIRSLTINDELKDCFQLFPPALKEEDECSKPCNQSTNKTAWYFVLFNKNEAVEDWQSVKYYDSAAEAMKAFSFFIFLLRYKGNYYIDCDCKGKTRIFIREVLAESSGQFSREDAWGDNGILQFICVAQSGNAFHYRQLQRKNDCCHSFDVGCHTLVHPCQYDTQETRDKALENIHAKWRKYAVAPFTLAGNVIKNANGDVIAGIVQQTKYALEIALETRDDESACHADWVSDYCFSNQQEAFNALVEKFAPLLAEKNNYKPVFDCTCGSYSVHLYEPVAYNPQCYPSAEMACAARALSLINSEGLHFIEHILLRPRSLKDCTHLIPACCDEFDNCKFIWEEESDDACKKAAPPVWFFPGYDPYSFIATAVIPAWPERFRKKENRLMMEDLLRREAPAHVMLRVLWLTPYDLCRFEHLFRQWTHWISYHRHCVQDFSMEAFIQMLFTNRLKCLPDCEACTCTQDPANTANCFPEKTQSINSADFRKQLDELFCWAPSTCPPQNKPT